jgi:hypothetical protein
MSHGQATRSTLTRSRVIQRIGLLLAVAGRDGSDEAFGGDMLDLSRA